MISSEWHPQKQAEKTEYVLIPRKGMVILYWKAEQSKKMRSPLILHFNMAQKRCDIENLELYLFLKF